MTWLAGGYIAHGHLPRAQACLDAALRWAGASGHIDHGAELLGELCELAARIGDQLAAEHPEHPGQLMAGHPGRTDSALLPGLGRLADSRNRDRPVSRT